jgi:ornithine cyclodeaminase
MIASGAHVNAVGAITPERRELAPSVLERCGLAAADDPQATARLASEFFDYAEKQGGSLRRLADLVGEKSVRPTDGSLTIFKAMGMGISDLSLATEIHKRARKAGVGRAFDHPVRAAPRLGLHDLQKEVAS